MARIEPVHYWASGIEIRPNLCTQIGDRIEGHVHDHPHLTLVARGRWIMRRARTQEGLAEAAPEIVASAAAGGGALPAWIDIPAGMWHAFEVLALENGVASLLCLWPGGVR
jgi:hypothetical protein